MQRIVGFIVAVVVINVLLRVVPVPDVDLPSLSLPDLPDWFGVVLKVKNVVLIGIVIAVIVTAVVEDHRRKAR